MRSSRTAGLDSASLSQQAGVASAPLPVKPGLGSADLFRLGDAAFLITVGVESGTVMQWLHQVESNFLLLSVLGMAVAMGIQMLLAFSLSPLLGSIETMAPSMVVAMAVPMLVDVGELSGWMMRRSDAAFLGAAFGFVYFTYLQWFEAAFRRRLARAWPVRAGR